MLNELLVHLKLIKSEFPPIAITDSQLFMAWSALTHVVKQSMHLSGRMCLFSILFVIIYYKVIDLTPMSQAAFIWFGDFKKAN